MGYLQAAAFGEGLAALLPQLQALTEILPPPTLAWKLHLLEAGNKCAPFAKLMAACCRMPGCARCNEGQLAQVMCSPA